MKKTELVLAGRSKEQMAAGIKAAFDKKEFPVLGPGAMCYMLSKQGYLSDTDGHWHPHLMFFVPDTDPEAWGAGLAGSPIVVGVKGHSGWVHAVYDSGWALVGWDGCLDGWELSSDR